MDKHKRLEDLIVYQKLCRLHMERMKTSVLAVCLLAAATAAADTVTTADATTEKVKVVSITSTELKLEDGMIFPVNTLRAVTFDASKVAAKQTGAVLADGTTLSGVVRKKEKAAYLFRLTALGELLVPEALLGGMYFDLAGRDKLPEIAASAPCVLSKQGEIIKGKILWVGQENVGMMTESGAKKLDASELSAVCFSKPKEERKIALRNGDVVNLPCEWKGDAIEAKFGDLRRAFPLASVAEVKFQ